MQTSPGGVRRIRGAMLAAAALLASGFAFSLVRGYRAAVASEEDASRSAEDTGVRLTLDWEDCSEEDEESDYEARLIGLAVRYTNSGKLVESIQGVQTLPLGENLTLTLTVNQSAVKPLGSTFAATATGFPFWLSGDACEPRFIDIPLGLGGVDFPGSPCPVQPGAALHHRVERDYPAAAGAAPRPASPPAGIDELWVDTQQLLPNGTKLTCMRVHTQLLGGYTFSLPLPIPSIPSFGWR
ncbi:hypothetical protein EMIHUDRAFT_443545 [Emiliania huxleyi CCMP1516]|uniref:MD-2-related lipid-recognition domain-containing protein n=2 Tax=Emiliania huxleyi TaxID=2903 RepID=A0A0D3JR09_EMIH1|nr:hypothetical protein EMIHUDRAFT_443545 [Emiliania huxleyi CCMP1516]EOD25944.1 hypothetical protein EMIHUDRAFT_443545 [Emiliania huxleyi CCMP1516]|eukprot:XP_005778373.1 hypothetical protein EMIHUDRAFT_443545 [Emiliania huxleyi CCMP1516]